MLAYPAWFTALDRTRIEQARTTHRPPVKPDGDGGYTQAYASDADALAALLAVLAVVADVLTRYHAHPERDATATRLRDELIVDREGVRPKDAWPDVTAFATAVEQALGDETLTAPQTLPGPPPTIGQQLTALRREAKWSVEDLANAMDMDKTNVQDHLTDKVTPKWKTVRLYETVLAKPLDRRVTITL